MAAINFNAENVTPAGSFEPIPPGRYNVTITNSEMCDTKAGDGKYLKLTFKVLDEEYAGRLIWSNLNLVNKNSKAVEIAERELSALCHATEILNPEDSQELHGIPISAQVKIRPAKDGWDAQNTISGFKEMVEPSNGGSAPWA